MSCGVDSRKLSSRLQIHMHANSHRFASDGNIQTNVHINRSD